MKEIGAEEHVNDDRKPIQVTVSAMGGQVKRPELPIGSTVKDALTAAGLGNIAAEVQAGRGTELRLRGHTCNLGDELSDGDVVLVVNRVKGG